MNSTVLTGLRRMGIRGILKSVYHSTRFTGTPTNLLMSKNVLTEIHRNATVDILSNSFLAIGLGKTGMSHPLLGKSRISITETGKLAIHDGAAARIGSCSVVHVEGSLELGDSYLNRGAKILCGDRISIGDHCAISWDVTIVDDNRHQLEIEGDRAQKTAPIEIGDDVWVGHDVTIKKGVTIGDDAVVASNTVVMDDVPPETLVGGYPAEPLFENVKWGEFSE